jgi:hypothetical protein
MTEPQEFIQVGEFTPEYEQQVRDLVNSQTGGHNMNPEAHRVPQDRLLRKRTIVRGNCGVAIEFVWASGRQDAYAMVDFDDSEIALRRFTDPEGTQLILDNHQKLIAKLKERQAYDANIKEAA